MQNRIGWFERQKENDPDSMHDNELKVIGWFLVCLSITYAEYVKVQELVRVIFWSHSTDSRDGWMVAMCV